MDLAWTDNTAGAARHRIDRSTRFDFSENLATFDVAAGVTTYAASALRSGTRYWFRVRSFDADGDSANSSPATGTAGQAELEPS
jgi:hypothetical protein